jgi:catechol 2,3-dioxygenase-like lactoylglutathione lyase family enzyme
MPLGAIGAVRVFTRNLEAASRFYDETLGLAKIHGDDSIVIFDTGQARLMIEQIDADDPEAIGLVGRFTAFSFTVSSMESVLSELAGHPIEWLSQRERQPWGGLLSFFKDPDGNVLTLAQYP